MLYGVYLSGHGANTQNIRLDTIANNLANVSTNTFKRDLAVVAEAPLFDVDQGRAPRGPEALEEMTGGPDLIETVTDYRGGPLERTDQPLDLAIVGQGFARVQTPDGVKLTRDLHLTKTGDGTVVTQAHGYPVLTTDDQPIRIPITAKNILATSDGRITYRDASGLLVPVGQVGLVDVADKRSLVKQGEGLYDTDAVPVPVAPQTRIKQGFLETSGVRPIEEMMDLIQTTKAVEANLNMLKIQDDSLDSLLRSLPPK